jgi:hypothetical protein
MDMLVGAIAVGHGERLKVAEVQAVEQMSDRSFPQAALRAISEVER